MITSLVGLVSLMAVGASLFVGPLWPWAAVGVIDALLAFMLVSVLRTSRYPTLEGLSTSAAALLTKFPHYYARPFAASDASRGAALMQFVGIAVGVVTAYRWGWNWLGASALNWFFMGFLACRFSPASLIAKSPEAAAANNEIVGILRTRLASK